MNVLIISHLYPNDKNSSKGVYVSELLKDYPEECSYQIVVPVSLLPPKNVFKLGYKNVFDWLKNQITNIKQNSVEVKRVGYVATPKGFFEVFEPLVLFFHILPIVIRFNKKKRIDLVHSHFLTPDGLVGYLISKYLKVPFVITNHGSDINKIEQKSKTLQKLCVYVLKKSNKIIAVSGDLKKKITLLGVDENKISVIPNGVDLKKFCFLKKANVTDTLKRILCIAYLRPIKGIDILLEATAELTKITDIKFELVIIGEGPLLEKLKNYTLELEIDRYVKFIGPVMHEQIPAWLNSADILVLSSRNEGWPTVINEAFACGIPVVSTNVGGVSEAIPSDEYGLLANKEDSLDLAKKLDAALCRNWDYEKIRERAINFSWNNISQKVILIYEGLIKF